MNLYDVKEDVLDKVADVVDAVDSNPELKEAVEDLVAVLPSAALSMALLVKANRARRRGDYLHAIYCAVLWVGVTNNTNSNLTNRNLRKYLV